MHFLKPRFVSEIPSPYARIYDAKYRSAIAFKAASCPACGYVIRQGYFRAEQLVLKKGLLPDMLNWLGFYVSGRFRAAWEAEGLSGIDAFLKVDTVKMLGKKAVVEEDYYLAIPSVSDVRLDIMGSKCVSSSAVIKDMDAYLEDIGKRSVTCKSCGRVRLCMHTGKLWEPAWKYPETWVLQGKNEDDLTAVANMPGVYILSDRFIGFVKRNRLTNVYALSEEELRFAQENEDEKEAFAFVPVYTDPDVKKALPQRPKQYWREADRGSIECKNGSFVIRDALDDDEVHALRFFVKAGLWCVERVKADILLRHPESVSETDMEAGRISIDAGALYLRAGGKDRRAESRIRSALVEMDDADILNNIKRMALSTRRGVPAAFCMTVTGDGEYKVYVDNLEETTAIRINLYSE